MITYNTLDTIKITVCFDNADQYNQFLAWKKSEDIIPCTVTGLRLIKYKASTAHYSKDNALRIEVWLRKQKAKLDKKIHL